MSCYFIIICNYFSFIILFLADPSLLRSAVSCNIRYISITIMFYHNLWPTPDQFIKWWVVEAEGTWQQLVATDHFWCVDSACRINFDVLFVDNLQMIHLRRSRTNLSTWKKERQRVRRQKISRLYFNLPSLCSSSDAQSPATRSGRPSLWSKSRVKLRPCLLHRWQRSAPPFYPRGTHPVT